VLRGAILGQLGIREDRLSKRTGLVEDVIEIGLRLPWGVSVALAGTAYIVLHVLASPAPAHPTDTGELGVFAGRQLLSTIAGFMQYILPVAFLLGAAVSYLRHRRGRILLADASADPVKSIGTISWHDFERLVGASFEKQGFAVAHTGGGGADGGVDLVLTKGRETTLVQCKQWRAQKVGVTTVRELYGVMAARGAARGIVVSMGDFTPDAREFVRGRNIDLMNGKVLAGIVRGAASDSGSPAATPTCPKCGARMLERVARRGSNAGQSFWGCETFPRCRAILSMKDAMRAGQ
jgi:restriction system protein